jgi:arsenate reductase
MVTAVKRVCFACIHNAGRSQMAAALWNALCDPTRTHAISAGTEPAARVHPEVATVLSEIGIDVSTAQPQKLTPELLSDVSLLITMGCGEACPQAPSSIRRDDWPLPDPKGQSLEAVRALRDDIEERVRSRLLAEGLAFNG